MYARGIRTSLRSRAHTRGYHESKQDTRLDHQGREVQHEDVPQAHPLARLNVLPHCLGSDWYQIIPQTRGVINGPLAAPRPSQPLAEGSLGGAADTALRLPLFPFNLQPAPRRRGGRQRGGSQRRMTPPTAAGSVRRPPCWQWQNVARPSGYHHYRPENTAPPPAAAGGVPHHQGVAGGSSAVGEVLRRLRGEAEAVGPRGESSMRHQSWSGVSIG